jgi:hypothetical protein
MSYENYRFVSWTDGTPITGERLSQMSTNIEQVKDATSDNPIGLIQLNSVTTDYPNSTGYSDFVEYEVIALKDNPPSDKRVTIGENRYYRITIHFPGFVVKSKGAEDSSFSIKMYQGLSNSSPTLLNTWKVTPPLFGYYDVSADTSATSPTVKANGYPSRFGAGVYSYVTSTSTGLTNQSFYVAVKRDQGASANNAPNYYLPAAGSSMQFYVEDIGGT